MTPTIRNSETVQSPSAHTTPHTCTLRIPAEKPQAQRRKEVEAVVTWHEAVTMQTGRSQRSIRRSPGAEPGPPPNVPIRSISPAVGITGSVQPRASTASNRSTESIERNSGSTKRPSVCSLCSRPLFFWPASLCDRTGRWFLKGKRTMRCQHSKPAYPQLLPPGFTRLFHHANSLIRIQDLLKRQLFPAFVPNRKERNPPPRRDKTTPRNLDAMVSRPGYRHTGV